MASPDHELVGRATARLRDVASLSSLVGGRVYYRPPADTPRPYVAVDETTGRRVDGDDLRAREIDLRIHVWTEGGNPLQDARAIVDAIAAALHDYPLPFTGSSLTCFDHRYDRVFYDSDGIGGHGVIDFTAYAEAND